MRLRSGISFVIVMFMFALPARVWACACCANTGFYHSGSAEVGDHVTTEMERLRFRRTASLYLTEAGLEEDARGITQPKTIYSLTASMVNKTWTLSFRSGRDAGTLVLKLPATMWNHSADIHDGKLSGGGGPLLYKEWRFEGDVTGTGIFQAGLKSPGKYMLVMQGRGNACDNAEDFNDWRLDVKSAAAGYAFYGKFIRPTPRK